MIACKNCQTEFEGKHCPSCGQKAKVKRITTKQVLEDIRQSTFHYDSGFFFTLFQMAKRPGHTVREFLEGKRVVHVKPIKYLIWASALNFLVFHLLGLDAEMINKVSENQQNKQFTTQAMEYIFQNPMLILILMLPCVSLFSWWLFRKNGNYNFAENFVLNSFLMGTTSMFGIVLSPITKLIGNASDHYLLKLSLNFLTYLLFFGWGYVQFFQPKNKWLGWFKAILSTVLGYLFMMLIVIVLVSVFILFMHSFFKPTLLEWFGKGENTVPTVDSLGN